MRITQSTFRPMTPAATNFVFEPGPGTTATRPQHPSRLRLGEAVGILQTVQSALEKWTFGTQCVGTAGRISQHTCDLQYRERPRNKNAAPREPLKSFHCRCP